MDLILARGMRHAEPDDLTFLFGGRVMQNIQIKFWPCQHIASCFTLLFINQQRIFCKLVTF
jgi:hypothetical protein